MKGNRGDAAYSRNAQNSPSVHPARCDVVELEAGLLAYRCDPQMAFPELSHSSGIFTCVVGLQLRGQLWIWMGSAPNSLKSQCYMGTTSSIWSYVYGLR